VGEIVEFASDGRTCSGYLAAPKGGRGPGVVVIQEWWGLVPHIEDVCDRFAAAGFAALAPDLYHGKTAGEPDEAGKLVMALRGDEAAQDIGGAASRLSAGQPPADTRVGVVGFCVGGGLALRAAARHASIAAAVTFYGLPRGEFDAASVHGAVLGHFAGNDRSYTRDQVDDLERALRAGGADVEVHWYDGAEHAFFNDTRPEVFAPEAARLAWSRTLAFFRSHLGDPAAPAA